MKNNYYNIFIIMSSGLLAGGINYLYYPLLLQYMTLEDFGLFGSIMGVLNMIGVITAGILFFLNKEISKNIEDTGKVKHLYLSTLFILTMLGILLFIIFSLFSPILASYFSANNLGYFILVGVTIIVSFMSTSIMSTLRAIKKYDYISTMQIITPIMKVGIGVGLVVLGYNIYGAIGGVVISGILGILISILYLFYVFRKTKKHGDIKEVIKDLQANKKELFSFFISSFIFAFFMNIDVILVQNIFDSSTAGAYVGVAVLGKFLIFLLLSIETVYYGQIMEYSKEQLPKHLLINPIVILLLVSIGAIITNYFIGKFVLGIIKSELISYYYIYMLSLIYYSSLAFISFFSKVLVGWNNYKGNILLGISVTILLITVYAFGITSLEAFIYCFIINGVITSVLLGLLFFYEWKQESISTGFETVDHVIKSMK